ncbi:MAG: nucleotidyl transferase AbiEii/AbiGii toxin family protein [Myxococcales bacterium]|nr:nucleotidyl transferase AbiEii/AbiGii toxin family protein [Myxococcales bacterium]
MGVPHALVGGLAVSSLAQPRLTRDVDLAVSVDSDAAAEELVSSLRGRGYRIEAAVERTRVHRLATVRLTSPYGVAVDLLFASSGVEPEVVRDARELEVLPGLRLRVARAGHLLALKLLSQDDRRRPQDLDDLRALLAVSGAGELRRAEAALGLIERRGYARRRRLLSRWRRLLLAEQRARGAPRRRAVG